MFSLHKQLHYELPGQVDSVCAHEDTLKVKLLAQALNVKMLQKCPNVA